MKQVQANVVRKQSLEEVKQVLAQKRRALIKMRLQKTSGEFTQMHLLKTIRREIAMLCTILAEKQGEK